MITHAEAVAYLETLKREYERNAVTARERGVVDYDAETKAQKFGEIAKLISQEETIK